MLKFGEQQTKRENKKVSELNSATFRRPVKEGRRGKSALQSFICVKSLFLSLWDWTGQSLGPDLQKDNIP